MDDEQETQSVMRPVAVGEPLPELLAVGTLLAGRYRILRFVARGGMGEVYEAMDTELQTRLAVKTVLPHLAADPAAIERVRREVQLARAVTDPHVCRLFDLSNAEVEGRKVTFITMELLEGQTLRARLRDQGPLPTDLALPLAIDVICGLDACHRAGVIHRDLKAENVLIVKRSDREHAVISDFGIARLEEGTGAEGGKQETLTREGMIVGSLAFIAPEQLNGAKASQRTDIYALGGLLWELVIGPWPLRGKNTFEVVRELAKAFPPPDAFPAGLEAVWRAVIQRCIAIDPEARYASAQEVLDDLAPGGPVRRTSSPALRLETATRRAGSARRRRRLIGIAAAAVALGLAVALAARWLGVGLGSSAPAVAPEALLEQIQADGDRLEFAKARVLVQALAKTDTAPGVVDFRRAVVEAGLGQWAEATQAAERALAAKPPLARRLRLQLELITKQAAGDNAAVLTALEALHTTDERDLAAALQYAEALTAAGRLDTAQTVLDGVAARAPSPVFEARLALARALRAHAAPRVIQADVDAHARAAIEAATRLGARVIEGRAQVLLSSAVLFQGRPDEATVALDRGFELLTAADDRRFLAIAHRMRGVIIANSGGSYTDALVTTRQAMELARAVKDDVALALALNGYASVQKELGALDEALAAYNECESVALRAGREDIADTRARPNRVALLDDLGQSTEAIRQLTALSARRPDPSGIENVNLANFHRTAGNLPEARRYAAKMDETMRATKNQSYRWLLDLLFAELAFDQDKPAETTRYYARAEALLNAMGAGESDADLALSRAKTSVETVPQEVETLVAPVLKRDDLTAWQRATLQPLLARAQLRLGKREQALTLRRGWLEQAAVYRRFAGSNLQAMLLDAELAEDAESRQAAVKALEAFARLMRENGSLLHHWDATLGVARLELKAGNKSAAVAAANSFRDQARQAGFVRLARAADAVLAASK